MLLNKAADPVCRAWKAPLRLDILGENCRQEGMQMPFTSED